MKKNIKKKRLTTILSTTVLITKNSSLPLLSRDYHFFGSSFFTALNDDLA